MGTRITDLPAATVVNTTDVVPIVQAGTTKKAEYSLLKTTNASDLTTGTVAVARLPLGSTSNVGALQLGTSSGTACEGDDIRLSNSRTPTGTAGGDLSGSYPNPTLANLSPSPAGTYGSSTVIPQISVNSKGQVTAVGTAIIPDTTNASNITSGTLSALRLPGFTGDVNVSAGTSLTTLASSGVAPGTYGSATTVPQIVVDAKGRVTNATSVPVSSSAGGTVTSVGVSSNTLAISSSPITFFGDIGVELPATGVTAGTVGSSTQIPVITADAQGRITALSTAFVSSLTTQEVAALTTAQLSAISVSAGTGLIGGGNLATNSTLSLAALSPAPTGSYGSTSQIPVLSVDEFGRITSASSVAVASSGGTVTSVGVNSTTLSVANSPVTTSGEINVNLSNSGVVAGTYGSSSQIPVLGVDQYGRITTASLVAIPPGGVTSFSAGSTGLTPNTGTTGAITLAGTLAIGNGGTGATTQQSALNTIAGGVTSGQYLRGNGTNVGLSAIQAADVPILNQNTTGTASNVTGIVALANGGTGASTQQAALNTIAGGVTSGQYLRGNGTNVTLSALQAADLSGTVAVPQGGTGASTLTGYVRGTGTAALSAIAAIPFSDVSGVLTSAQFPALTGDVTTTAGSLATTIGNVSAGAVVGSLRETVLLNGTAAASYTIDTLTQAVVYVTANATAAFSINIRASSGISLNAHMAIGQSLTVVFMATQGTTAYFNSTFTIDGAVVTRKWQTGTVPSANASGIDVYVYTIVKTAASTFTVFATLSKYA